MNLQEFIYKIKSKFRNISRKRLGTERPTSYPFISGDTFRAFCDFRIESDKDLDLFLSILSFESRIKTLFVSISYVAISESNFIIKLMTLDSNFYSDIKLVLHNGDYSPSSEFLNKLSDLFKTIYCVNATDTRKNIIPIPVGLENFHYYRNGKLEEFLAYQQNSSNFKKNIMISGCFSLATNFSIRSKVVDLMKKSRFDCVYTNLNNYKYLNILKHSLFTISPPGNGYDCHRTWEALYLNAIPVVLDGYLAKSIYKNLPIYSVSCYSDILSKDDAELCKIYSELTQKKIKELAYFDYWKNSIVSND